MPKGRKKGSIYTKLSVNKPEKILNRFKKKYTVDLNSGCWVWLGNPNYGYGTFYMNGKHYPAHRASYEIFVKPVPFDLMVCHGCNNGMCVNPHHLYVGTHQHNMRDLRKSGALAGKNNPSYGKIFSDERKQNISKGNKKAWRNEEIRNKYIKAFQKRGTKL